MYSIFQPHWQGLTYELLGAARARTVIRYFRGRVSNATK